MSFFVFVFVFDFGPFGLPFWLHLGSPNRSKKGSQSKLNSGPMLGSVQGVLTYVGIPGLDIVCNLSGRRAPGALGIRGFSVELSFKSSLFAVALSQRVPRRSQEAFRGIQEASGSDFGATLDRIWDFQNKSRKCYTIHKNQHPQKTAQENTIRTLNQSFKAKQNHSRENIGSKL